MSICLIGCLLVVSVFRRTKLIPEFGMFYKNLGFFLEVWGHKKGRGEVSYFVGLLQILHLGNVCLGEGGAAKEVQHL